MHKLLKKSLAYLAVLAMVCTLMPSIAFESDAAAAASVTVTYVDKAGTEQEVEKWYYDNDTYKVGSAEGSELSIVKDFTTKDSVAAVNPTLATYMETSQSGYGIPYTGINRKPDPRCLAVTTTGIIFDDMVEYFADKSAMDGMDLKGDTKISAGPEYTYDEYWAKDRFYYPDWYAAESNTAANTLINGDTYASGDTTAGNTKGYKVPTTLAVKGYHNALFEDSNKTLANLISLADSANALRNTQGQLVGGNATDLNLGADSWKYINKIKFTPVYNSITVADGTASGTEGTADYKYAVDGANISTDDNYFKAASGEAVTLKVIANSNWKVDGITVKDADENDITVDAADAANGNYKFAMPATAVTVSVSAEAVEWNGKAANTSWYNDNDTEFAIDRASQLAGLAKLVNDGNTFAGKKITLTDDILLDAEDDDYTTASGTFGTVAYAMTADYYTLKADANIWTPIGTAAATGNSALTDTKYFCGTFDGNGKTVAGLYTDGTKPVQGLFGCLGEGAAVKNLTVQGCVTAKFLAGGIAAYVDGASIENCQNEAVVYADGGQTADSGQENGVKRAGAIGGIAGNAAGTVAIKDCVNTGAVTCTNTSKGGRTGGILGLIDNSSDSVSVSQCINSGVVDAYQYSGGIVGYNYSSTSSPIDKCVNTAKVIIHSPGSAYGGGIISNTKSDISNCYNTGAILAQLDGNNGDKAAHFGGIVSDFTGTDTQISNCYNTGTLSYGGNATTASSNGAICGSGYGSASNNKLNNCYALKKDTIQGEDAAAGCVKVMEADTLKSLDTAKALGEAYKYNVAAVCGNDGYPVLSWQVEEQDDSEAIIAAVSVVENIDKIGKVSLSDATTIKKAREEYDALTPEAKAMISEAFLDTLTEAEEDLANLQDNSKLIKSAAKVENKIDEIGTVNLKSEAAIVSARQAYDALDDGAKYLVENYDVLEDAEDALTSRKADADAVTPKAATGMKAVSTSYKSLKITWSKTQNAAGYELYRSTSKTGTYSKVATVTGTAYTNSGLTCGKAYYYKIKAYNTMDGVKLYADDSTISYAKPIPATTAVKATAGSKKATVSWKKVSGATGYALYRSTSKLSGYKCIKLIKKGSTVKYVNRKLKKGKTYYYKVKAYKTMGGTKIYGNYSLPAKVKVK